jgi:SAM-dependent methyltransferase
MIEFRHRTPGRSESVQEAYNEIYRSTGILHHDSMYNWLIRFLKPQPGRNLLDISCGEGRLVYLAQKLGLNAIGMDFAIAGVQKGCTQYPEAGWSAADGELLPLADASIDYVTHIGSLEHYAHPPAGAAEIARVLKPGGKACIMLPNTFGLTGNIRHVIKTGDVHDDGQPLQRYATRGQWQSLLENAGLRVTKVVGYEGSMVVFPRTLKELFWFFRHPGRLIRLIISPFVPINLSNHLIYICVRANGSNIK